MKLPKNVRRDRFSNGTTSVTKYYAYDENGIYRSMSEDEIKRMHKSQIDSLYKEEPIYIDINERLLKLENRTDVIENELIGDMTPEECLN